MTAPRLACEALYRLGLAQSEHCGYEMAKDGPHTWLQVMCVLALGFFGLMFFIFNEYCQLGKPLRAPTKCRKPAPYPTRTYPLSFDRRSVRAVHEERNVPLPPMPLSTLSNDWDVRDSGISMYHPGAAHHSHPLSDASSSVVLSLVDEAGNVALYQVSPLVRVGDVLAYHFGKHGYIAHANAYCRHPLASYTPTSVNPATNLLPHLVPVAVDSHATHTLAACSGYSLVVNCNENSCQRCGGPTTACGCAPPTLCSLTSGCGLCIGQGFVLKYRGCRVPLHALVGEAWGNEHVGTGSDACGAGGSEDCEMDHDGVAVTRQCYIECDYSWAYLRLACLWDAEHVKWGEAQREWSAQWAAAASERAEREKERQEREEAEVLAKERERQARAEWEKERREWDSERASMAQQVDKMNAEKETREKEINTLRDRLRRAEQSAGEASGRDKKKVEKHANQLKERVDEQNRLLTHHKQREEEYKQRVSALESRVAESENVRDATEKEMSKLRAKAARCDSLQERLDKALDAEAENSQLKLRMTQLTRERDELVRKAKEREKEKEKEREKKRSARDQERDLANLRYRIQHLEHEASEWKYRYTTLANNLESSIYHAKMARDGSRDGSRDDRGAPAAQTGSSNTSEDRNASSRPGASCNAAASDPTPSGEVSREHGDGTGYETCVVGSVEHSAREGRDTREAPIATAKEKDSFQRYRDAREYVPQGLTSPTGAQLGSGQGRDTVNRAGARRDDALHNADTLGNAGVASSGSTSSALSSSQPVRPSTQTFPSSSLGYATHTPSLHTLTATTHLRASAPAPLSSPGLSASPLPSQAVVDSLLSMKFHTPYNTGAPGSAFAAAPLHGTGPSLGAGMGAITPFQSFSYHEYLDKAPATATHATQECPSLSPSSSAHAATDSSLPVSLAERPYAAPLGMRSFPYSYLPQPLTQFDQAYASSSATSSSNGYAGVSAPLPSPNTAPAISGMGLFGWDPFPSTLSGVGFGPVGDGTAAIGNPGGAVGMGVAWGSIPRDADHTDAGLDVGGVPGATGTGSGSKSRLLETRMDGFDGDKG